MVAKALVSQEEVAAQGEVAVVPQEEMEVAAQGEVLQDVSRRQTCLPA